MASMRLRGWKSKLPMILLLAAALARSAALGGEIHSAAEAGKIERVQELLRTNTALINTKDEKGQTPVQRALLSVKPELVQLLAPAEAEMDIFVASALGKTDQVTALLKKDPTLAKSRDGTEKTALHWAALYGQDAVAALLLGKQAEVAAKDSHGFTPLHWAAMYDSPGVALLLLGGHAPIDAQEPRFGWTPLRIAAINNRLQVAEVLLRAGANPNLKNVDGYCPLHEAVSYNRKEVVELLVKYKADLNVRDTNDHTPLFLALKKHKDEIAAILRKHGALE